MSEETIDLYPVRDGKFGYVQMTFEEDRYCQLVAEGSKRRAAYRLAFNRPDATDNAIDQWIHRVKKDRPDIAARIGELKAAIMDERRELWMNRQWEALEKLWLVFISTIGNPETAMIGVKCYQLMGGTVGWTPGGGSSTSITINNSGNATAQGALPQQDANAKIRKLLELTAPKEDAQQ